MQFLKISCTPLQSRFAISLVASIIVVIIYFSLNPRSFAYATELDSILNQDHNHHRLAQQPLDHGGPIPDVPWEDEEEHGKMEYLPDFLGVVRSIIGRAEPGTTALDNNIMKSMNLQPNSSSYWVFPNSTVFGAKGSTGDGLPSRNRRSNEAGLDTNTTEDETKELKSRQAGTQTVYITINTCLQPQLNGTASGPPPPQLTMYISSNMDKPGPDSQDDSQIVAPLTEGYNYTKIQASGDVYIGVFSDCLYTEYSSSAQWNYEIAASIDGPYHFYNATFNDGNLPLYLTDTDASTALLVTGNLTQDNATDQVFQDWMQTPRYTLFMMNSNSSGMAGLRQSYCGLKNMNQTSISMEMKMTTKLGMGDKPKQQFYVQQLNSSSTYDGYLAMAGNSTASGSGVVGGGGTVWKAMNFATKTSPSPFPSTQESN